MEESGTISVESQPSWHRVAIAVGLMGLILVTFAHLPAADLDMYHEMALIREALRTGALPRYDTFAFTSSPAPVVHHEWGTGAVLYLIAVTAGMGGTGIVLLRFLLVAGTVALCVAVARRRGAGTLLLAALAPVAVSLGSNGLSPVRAHLFTFLFVACLLLFFELDRAGRRWWLPAWLALYVVWLNMHGGFVVGAGLFGLYAVERVGCALRGTAGIAAALRSNAHLLVTGVLMVPASLVNPYGAEYLSYLWHALTLDRPFVHEWASLLSGRSGWSSKAIFLVSVLVLAYALRQRRTVLLPGMLLLAVTAVMTIRSQRLLPIYAIVWIAHVPAWLAGSPLEAELRNVWRKRAPAIAAVVLVVGLLFTAVAVQRQVWKLHVPNAESRAGLMYPVGAVDYLREHGFTGDLMTHYNHGSYVSWQLYPAVRVGMDSRYEVAYDPATAQENVDLYNGVDEWRDILKRHAPQAVLVARRHRLFERLTADGDGSHGEWVNVYVDDGFGLFFSNSLAGPFPVVDRTGEQISGTFP